MMGALAAGITATMSHSLQELDLSNTSLSQNGIKGLMKALLAHPRLHANLVRLDLSGNNFGKKATAEFMSTCGHHQRAPACNYTCISGH
jgi:Ran GTPase-activating protein (RanGAP) involved in mRNA processing and transport